MDLDVLLDDVNKSTHNPITLFKKPSTKFPPSAHESECRDLFKTNKTKTLRDICKLPHTKTSSQNLTIDENEALELLCNNVTIVIKPSDKGGNVVLMDNQDYLRMCQRILDNKDWYRSIPAKLIESYYTDFYTMIDRAFERCVITKDLHEFIRTKHPRVATFYSLPKIHKGHKPPPGRPIVSGNGGISENLSRVIDSFLQPFVLSMPSFLTDTIHFLQSIEELILLEKSILVAIDVEALYCSIC